MDARLNCSRCFPAPVVGQLLEIDALHIQLDIEPIQERPTDALLVAPHLRLATGTGMQRIAIVPTWTRIHGGDQHDVSRERYGPLGPRNGHDLVFERLAKHFDGAAQLKQFIQQRYLKLVHPRLSSPGLFLTANTRLKPSQHSISMRVE